MINFQNFLLFCMNILLLFFFKILFLKLWMGLMSFLFRVIKEIYLKLDTSSNTIDSRMMFFYKTYITVSMQIGLIS